MRRPAFTARRPGGRRIPRPVAVVNAVAVLPGTMPEARDVGDVTEAVLPLSKDNYFFGVRAYDRDGYRSPVAFPTAARE